MQKLLIALSILGAAHAATEQECCRSSTSAAPCCAEDCEYTYRSLGPVDQITNTPVNPRTCCGWGITVGALYWKANQDGMEYGIDDHVAQPDTSPSLADLGQLNFLVDAEYLTPDFDWNWGLKLGLNYNGTCDGWDFGILWTWYNGKANDSVEADADDNHVLLPLWSAFASSQGRTLFASNIETHWKLKLNLIDFEMGREYWVSRYLSFRPFASLRLAYIKQDFDINNKGGSWRENTNLNNNPQDAFNNQVNLENNFHGVGIRSGFNTIWNLGCGWSLYGDLAGSIVYGRFNIHHKENNREATGSHSKIELIDTKDSFIASRGIVDLGLGLQWSIWICDCQYAFTVSLGWEQHLFLHQNQMWRVNRIADVGAGANGLPNNTGENVFLQRRGDLSTQGATFKVLFEF